MQQPVGRIKTWLRSLHCDGWRGLGLLGVCALLLAVELSGDAARMALRYDREAIGGGEWWRLLTGHFVHLNLEHAMLNVAGLALLWALFARDYGLRQWIAIVLMTLASIDTGLWIRDPQLAWYAGASGALHGVLAAGTLAHWRRREFDRWILGLFLIGKLGYEQFFGVMPFSAGIGPVVVNAHLYGAVGAVAGAAIRWKAHAKSDVRRPPASTPV